MTYTILIVEDEFLVRQGLTKLVNVAAYDMEIIGQAENGRQAWELIQKQVPDIILTDINMPQLNGIQLASLVRETYPQVHLVFGNKADRKTIDTVAQATLVLWSIRKDMTKVRISNSASYFHACHIVGLIFFVGGNIRADWLRKTRPATTRLKLIL